jgi:4-hydroxy-tetrahydrodipicolinate synthase
MFSNNSKNHQQLGEKMKEKQFTGTGTALITPFKADGQINYTALEYLVDLQIDEGIDFLVPCGTTGESPTLSPEEHKTVIAFVVEKTAGRVPVLAGTGSNNTAEALPFTQAAKVYGAAGALVVMPYYNKPTANGIRMHYRALAEVGLPIVLYDIPGRCGGSMIPAEIILELAREGTIQGLKWASGNLDQLMEVLANRPKNFAVFSGDDNLTYPAMCLGADGVISVLSNLLPEKVSELVGSSWLGSGYTIDAKQKHYRLLPLMRAMFIETNPQPVKTALALMHPGVFLEVFRSPLVPMEEKNKEKLKEVLKGYGLIG